MKEDETILEYDGKIRRLANEPRLLGDPFPEKRLVRKVLRSLNTKFSVKAIVIAEANNIDKMTLNEVIGSLCTFETEMEAKENTSPVDDQNIAFTGETRKPGQSSNELLEEQIANLSRGFNKLYRKFSKRGNPFKCGEKKAKKCTAEQKRIHCHGCDGYGHIQAECPTIQKKKKAHNVTLSDSDSNSSDSEENYTVFFAGVQEGVPPPEIPEDDFTLLKDVMKREESLKLQEKQIEELQNELFSTKQILKRLEKGKGKLDEILSSGKISNDKSGLGYTGSTSKRQTIFVKEGFSKRQTMVVKEGPQVKRTHKKFKRSGCYYCQNLGHIQSQCYKLFRDLKYSNKGFRRNHLKHKFIWVRKKVSCNHALKAVTNSVWYFDSGCSRHMTGKSDLLSNISYTESGQVTFGDGGKGTITVKGTLNVDGLPRLQNVLLVQGLQANLISISQLCDENLQVHFTSDKCLVADHKRNLVMEGVRTGDNCYKLIEKLHCYTASSDSADNWHRKLGHVHFRHIQQLIKHAAVKGFPEIKNIRDKHCGDCQQGKQHKTKHKSTTQINTTRPLELLHVDLMGLVRTPSHKGRRYIFVCVDDFSRFCWVDFLREKLDTFESFQRLCSKVMVEKGAAIQKIIRLKSDHGKEFENKDFADFYDKEGIHHEFSAPKIPQQNGVVERKNRTMQEMARVMLLSKGLPDKLWAEAVNTACYITNRVFFRPFTHKTPYELYKRKKPTVSHFHNFGSKCYILCDREVLGKFVARSNEGIFLGYSTKSRAYRVYNKRTRVIMESVNVTVFDDDSQSQRTDEDLVTPSSQTQNDTIPEVISVSKGVPESHNDDTIEPNVDTPIPDHSGVTKSPSSRIQKNHPTEAIIGDLHEGVKTRGIDVNYRDMVRFVYYTSSQEPKKIEEALNDEYWVLAMQEELHQFERNKGYTQVEGVDFEEAFAPVARLEAIRLMISIACQLKIKLYQMDIKSAFLNGYISEEVFVEQPKGFIDPHYLDYVYKLYKALYGLKQAPRAWYDHLTAFLIGHGYCRDDMIFGATKRKLLHEFVQAMKHEFEMSMVGELSFFLGFQIKQLDNGIFLSQEKYAKEMVQKFGMEHTKPKTTPMGTNEKLHRDSEGVGTDQHLYKSMIGSLLYLTASRPDLCFTVGVCARYQANPKESHLQAVKRILRYVHETTKLGIFYSNSSTVALAGYSDADWFGNSDDKKSTSGGCFYLGTNLVAWYSKKQNSISLSTAEAEYIATGSCCTQLLWMKQMLADYGFEQDILTVFCDNTSAIDISKRPVQHSRTKHIDIRYHFIRELVFKRELLLAKVHLDETSMAEQPTVVGHHTDSALVDLMDSSPSSSGNKKGAAMIVDRLVSFFLTKLSTPKAVEAASEDQPKEAASARAS
ncbi:hypothetical protein H6P81_018310 [Aristolochia fimbriata]|uniref:Integrase catalytic domain-containing protein n=1 Tax=Aristolochia fimbriata TaxID=158543 RepID=A0AAV7E3V7_ARIFI|nr:hypothetical protein H6P81_018310 [Aristolochia fimbriata]